MYFRFQISDFRFYARFTGAVIFLAALFFGGAMLRAADASVQASLSDNTAEVGQAVELQIKVSGARNAAPPSNISIDGLSIGGMSQSSNSSFNFINGSLSSSSSTTFTFPIIPERAGTFTIPALTLEADGKKFTTRPLTLTVTGSGSGSNNAGSGNSASGNNPATKSDSDNRIAFAELIVPKQNAYVGEAIPAEIRVYFDARIRVQANQPPTIKGEGLTIQKFAQPHEEQIEKDGKSYNFVTYKTAITPVKSGKLVLGPVEMPFVAVVPVKRRVQRPRFGNGFDDMFNDPFFNDAFGGYEQRQLVVKSDGVNLEVKPLPDTGKPKGFAGAVGKFELKTGPVPDKIKVGDPVTLSLKITGRGNFERVSAPRMVDESGWRGYPASGKFTADDDVGISGEKVFELAVIPDAKKTKLPAIEFSYFDPFTEKYVTLNAERLPIVVEGTVAAQTPAGVQSTPTALQSPDETAQAEKKNDIHHIVTGSAGPDKGFTPIYRRQFFWTAQIAPLLALIGFAGIQLQRRRGQDLRTARLAELKREKYELMKTLQRTDASAKDFYAAAVRSIQIEAALNSGENPASVGAAEAILSKPIDETTADGVRSIFDTSGELLYAGSREVGARLSDEKRRQVLETINRFENARA
jgi:hypothetical protein